MPGQPQYKTLLQTSPELAARVRTLKPYDAVSSREKIDRNPSIQHHKLDWNESTIQPSPKVHAAIARYITEGGELHWYPDLFHTPLYDRLAGYTGSRVTRMLVTNGSDAALELLAQSYLNADDNVVFPVPTYNHFVQFAELTGAQLRGIKCSDPFVPTLVELERHIDARTKILYLVNPNNPTGNVYDPEEVLALALRHPSILVISDEAYFEFSGVSCMDMVDRAPNIVVTRSFSKAFSLASVRIGYMVAQEGIINDLRRVYNPKSVNMLAQIATTAALDDLPYYAAYVAEVKRSAQLVVNFCRRLHIPCRTAHANWIMMEFRDAPEMARKMADAGIHVRDRSSQLPNVLRMSLGTEAQTVEVLARIERILEADKHRPHMMTTRPTSNVTASI